MGPAAIGAIASIGSSILSGLFGRSGAQKDAEMQWAMQKDNQRFHREMFRKTNRYNNPKKIRKRAERAGFNPLAFIGAGVGNANFSTPYAGNFNPVFTEAYNNIGRSITDATAQIQAYQVDQARLEMENQRLQMEVEDRMLKENIGGIYGTKSTSGMAGRTGTLGGTMAEYPPEFGSGMSLGFSEAVDGNPGPNLPDEFRPGHIDTPFGELTIDKRWSPKEVVEQESGDLIAEIYGVVKTLHEIGYNYAQSKKRVEQLWKQSGRDPRELSLAGRFDQIWEYLQKKTKGAPNALEGYGLPASEYFPVLREKPSGATGGWQNYLQIQQYVN